MLTAPHPGQVILPLNGTADTVSCLWQCIHAEIQPDSNLIMPFLLFLETNCVIR